jgi:WD repeat-containing protein 61
VIFDVSTSSIVHHLDAHSMSVRTLAFTEDSSLLLTGSDDKHIHVHDVKSGTTVHVLSGHDSFIFCIRVSPDKKHFASCSSDRTVRIWELSTMECIHIFENVHKDQIWSLAYNNDGSLLASVGSDFSLRLYHCPLDESK